MYTSSDGHSGENGRSAFRAGGRSFAIDERQDRASNGSGGGGGGGGGGRFLDQPHPGSVSDSGGSALDELVLRLRTGPLGRLPDTSALQPPPAPASCD